MAPRRASLRRLFSLAILLPTLCPAAPPSTLPHDYTGEKLPGYRGIWFTLGQRSRYGDKYSGGLGTYPANHIPIAVYAPKVDKTFFVYGGTPAADQRHLLIMASWYDHKTGTVPRPTCVFDKRTVNDPHDNAAINLDADGHLWVFISGRGRARPGFLYRSREPYSTDAFDRIEQHEMTYPQPHYFPDSGFFYLFTKYTAGRELYFRTSPDGRTWSDDTKLAGFGGHYQVSNHVIFQSEPGRPQAAPLIATTFMWHPNGDVDKRTNLYYLQTTDLGKTWTTAAGVPIPIPLSDPHNPALITDYQSRHENVYIHDLNFDAAHRPVILFLTSHGAAPGPDNGPYTWRLAHFTGAAWTTTDVATSDHNYDTSALTIDGPTWTILGPTGTGPQPWAAGGEMSLLRSPDSGQSWLPSQPVTQHSPFNHTYARRPLAAHDPFAYYWADGNPDHLSESHLYFCDSAGVHVRRLPYTMTADTAAPESLDAPR